MKSMSIKNLLVTVTVGLSSNAMAGGGGDATEFTQIMNNFQLIMSYEEQAQQTVTQIKQYRTMIQNLQRLNPSGLLGASSQKIWKDANMDETFRDLYRLTINGQRIAYTLRSIDDQFAQLHPGYGNYRTYDYQKAYRNWSDNTRSAGLAALRVAAVQAEDIQSESDLIEELRQQSASADGQLKALQAGNQVGVMMVSQMQKLRQLQMSQIQAQNTTALAESGRREASDETLKRFYPSRFEAVPTIDEIRKKRGQK